MKYYTLSASKPETDVFHPGKPFHLIASGKGSIEVLTDVGSQRLLRTLVDGTEMAYIREDGGVIFNGVIDCATRVPHVIRANTSTEIRVYVFEEK